ncbi:MAG TPA: Nif3-like dinuclear metal center hexameric protein [Microlunatus sp.]
MTTVGDLQSILDRHYPTGSAQSWDRVGLVTGAVEDQIRGVLLTVDVTDEVIEQAIELDANVIIAHHPLLLRGINAVDPGQPKGRMITALIRQRIALITAHTNADIPSGGVADSLASALGLTDIRPLQLVPLGPVDTLISYLPGDRVDTVIDALSAAGAGRIGLYERCAHSTAGTGTFQPLPGANPVIGAIGNQEEVAEHRIEMIFDRSRRSAVLQALFDSHPYEQPAYQVIEVAQPADSGPAAGLGRIGAIEPTTVAGFADHVASVLPATAGGVRVAGDPERRISTVALQAGAGDDLLDVARRSGADLYLTSDLRHHPALEAVAWQDSPALIDVAHWAAEWTWLPRLQQELRTQLDDPAIKITVSELRTDPWDFVAHGA